MKKTIFILFSMCFITSTFAQEKEFTHAKPDTSEMIIEVSGLLNANMKQCSFSQEDTQKLTQYLSDMREVVHFYDEIPYQAIDDYAKQSENYYLKHVEYQDCTTAKEHLNDMIDFSKSVIFEQLYMKIQNMPKEDFKNLNQQYIYQHKFISSKFKQYSAGQNEDGSVWIGEIMSIEQCQKKAIKTKNSSMPSYCDNGYSKTKVYIPN